MTAGGPMDGICTGAGSSWAGPVCPDIRPGKKLRR